MSLSATEISLVVDELAPALTGGWIQKVFQPTPRSIVLEVRAPGHTHRLLLSAHPSASRLHLVTQPLQNPPTPPGFCQSLRAHLQGARIDHVRQEAGDRIVSIGDLRTLSPLDEDTILESVEQTGRLVIVDEAYPRCSIAADISSMVADKGFSSLKAPIAKVTAPHCPVPFAKVLEDAFVPSPERIGEAVMRVMSYKG